MLLTCGAAGLRAVSLPTEQLAAHEPTVFLDKAVWGVAFDSHTGTLLLLVVARSEGNGERVFWLVSLRRNASEWLEVQRFNTIIRVIDRSVADMAVCNT